MKIVIFGLTVSSSWGNGHATLWRGLCRALARRRCRIVFFERDTPYYAANRDMHALAGGDLVLYPDWDAIRQRAASELGDADIAIATSYCPDAVAAGTLLLAAPRPVSVFYDLDTPITLSRLQAGAPVAYLGPRGLADYDLVLSYTGGGALQALRDRLGARRVAPLYGHADPKVHRPVPPSAQYRADLSYLGTYAPDRQAALAALLVAPAGQRPWQRFLIGGAQYPEDFPWRANIFFVRHMPPAEHPAFFCSSRMTLNITRQAMAAMGWCPSGRLFEAAACGTAIVSDRWAGLEEFFSPGGEILLAGEGADVVAALDRDDAEIRRIARAGRDRVLAEHTSDRRAGEFLAAVDAVRHDAATAPAEAMEA